MRELVRALSFFCRVLFYYELLHIDKCYILLYTVYRKKVKLRKVEIMNIIINNNSIQPIYEQIAEQIKQMVVSEKLKEGDPLPSVRALAKDLKISALTVKKAYDTLETEGFIVTVHGKGSSIAGTNADLLMEEKRKATEIQFEKAIKAARACGMSDEEIIETVKLIIEE